MAVPVQRILTLKENIYNNSRRESERVTEERQESFDDMTKRFTQNQALFITNEALQILYETCDVQVKLDALKILAAQR